MAHPLPLKRYRNDPRLPDGTPLFHDNLAARAEEAQLWRDVLVAAYQANGSDVSVFSAVRDADSAVLEWRKRTGQTISEEERDALRFEEVKP
jgi:hypothetical protein